MNTGVETALRSGGINRLTRVQTAQGTLVSRRWPPPELAARLGIEPAIEVAAQRLAAAQGLAPAVLQFEESERTMWMPFVEGSPLERDWFVRPVRRAAIQELLERLRGLDAGGLPAIDLPDRLLRLHAGLAMLDRYRAAELAAAVRGAIDGWPTDEGSSGRSLVHGDLSPDNVIVRADGSLCLLDWEYAHRGHGDEDLVGLAALSDVPESVAADLEGWSLSPASFAARRRFRAVLDTVWIALAAATAT